MAAERAEMAADQKETAIISRLNRAPEEADLVTVDLEAATG
jgi:hypothetical protein